MPGLPAISYSMFMNGNPIWKLLLAADPEATARNSGAAYDAATDKFIVPSFSTELLVHRSAGTVASSSPFGERLLTDFRDTFFLAAPAYLAYADGRPVSGKLIQPKSLSGGEIYRKGAHSLPLTRLAKWFTGRGNHFLAAGRKLGGEPLEYGDVSLRLYPFPCMPIHIILWHGDEEFPERADLLFDTSSNGQFPPDVLWGVAVLCVELLCIK